MAAPFLAIAEPLREHYVLERELGRGGMATVYLARDLKHNRLIALKVLRPDLAATLGPDRFLREIQLTVRLQHPHILPVLDSGEAAGQLWYTMPYVEGESLRDRLRRETQLPVKTALEIGRQIALALEYAHRHDVIHRDIKPENVLLSDDQALIADFGIAKALDEAGGEKLTETGLSLGTPAYMSPEQATAGSVDARTDIYSLGCVVYEMLAGEPPFSGSTPRAVMARHAVDPVPSIRTVRPGIQDHVERAIHRALQKVPADRFGTANEFAAALCPTSEGAIPLPRPRISARRIATFASASLVTAGVAFALMNRAHRPAVTLGASVIAVLPPTPGGVDSALYRLGRDLALTVSANLDGLGEIRTVDPHTLLHHVDSKDVTRSLERDAALGRHFGAGSVVHGSLVRVGRAVRADLGLFTSDSQKPLARVSITAPAESTAALTDSITWGLLRQIWRARAPPTPTLTAVTTHSVPALRAFLDGERAWIEGVWSTAEEGYGRAIAADSTFWLAYWRYAYARGIQGKEVDSAITTAYTHHRDALPEREQLIVEANFVSPDSLSAAVALSRRATERFPDSWFAWFDYGDFLMHFFPLLGTTTADARAAFERTVALNPDLIPAWQHLLWLALQDRDTATSTRALDALTRLDAGPALADLQGANELLHFRLLDRLQRVGVDSCRALMDSVARDLATNDKRFLPSEPFRYGYFGPQIVLDRAILKRNLGTDATRRRRFQIALAWAGRGAWDSALAVMDEYVASAAWEGVELDRYRLGVLAAWVGVPAAGGDESVRVRAGRSAARLESHERAELGWLDGVLATTHGDLRGLAAARVAVRETADNAAPLLDQSLATFELAVKGKTRDAGEQLARLEWAQTNRLYHEIRDFPAMLPIHRLAASTWLLAAGDTAQAVKLLSWVDGALALPGGFPRVIREALAGLVYLQRARIEDARGQTELSQDHYHQFLWRYDMPVAAHQHLVRDALVSLASSSDSTRLSPSWTRTH